MNKHLKSAIAAALAAAMLLTGCTGGGSSSTTGEGAASDQSTSGTSQTSQTSEGGVEVSPAGELPIVSEPVEVTLAIEKGGQVEDYVDNLSLIHI